MKAVLLRHPITGGEWACPPAAVDGWVAKGWKRASETVPAALNDDEVPAVPAVVKTEITGKGK